MAHTIIRPAADANKDAIACIHYEALEQYNRFYQVFFVNQVQDSLLKATHKALQDPKTTFLVAEDSETKVIQGFIRFEKSQPAPPAEPQPSVTPKSEQESEKDNKEKPAEAPSIWAVRKHLEPIWNKINGRCDDMDTIQEKTVGSQTHIYIRHLMISPEWQRRGVGTKLLNTVLAQADAEGIPCYIVSSAESQNLYLKSGFEDLGTWHIDNEHWAKEIVHTEKELDMQGNEWLVEEFAGVGEVEKCMVKWPKKAEQRQDVVDK
ncbi:acyl-CoA N-acyltransferase [Stachybotrys elegans]|uniref:Acyl-CoA N-acyltransferase n=1 Tax=Stachybotrys elegans TaxID=80388 RepID=A0A8K0SJ92_9HYPO|nr:acyl-CoA N-acyltransferase [Stachybotrys elegans]